MVEPYKNMERRTKLNAPTVQPPTLERMAERFYTRQTKHKRATRNDDFNNNMLKITDS